MSLTAGEEKIAILFPGQGAFDGASLRAAARRHPQVTQVFEQIDAVSRELFSRTLSELLFADDAVDLPTLLTDAPWVSQLSIYGGDLAAYRILQEAGVEAGCLVGHSLGEIAALVAAGVYTVADGARLVAMRVASLERHGADGGMLALSAGGDRARRIVELIDVPDLAVAVENHPGQTVVSGGHDSLATVRGIAEQLRIGTVGLEAPFPFHSPVLAGAAAAFAAAARSIERSPAQVPVYSPILRRYYGPDDELPDLLAEQLIKPVAFGAGLLGLYDEGYRVFVEAGGRDALTKVVGPAVGDGQVRALATFARGRQGQLVLEDTLLDLRLAGAGIDLLAQVGRFLLPGVGREEFAGFWAVHGGEIASLVGERYTRMSPAQPPGAAPLRGQPPDAPATAGHEGLVDRIRFIYAAALEYPEEVLTDDALLEADLGVDSVKQVELLKRVYQDLGVETVPKGATPGAYETIGEIARTLAVAMES